MAHNVAPSTPAAAAGAEALDEEPCGTCDDGPRDWQRFYLGYRERFVLDCCIPLPNGKEVRLRQAPSAKQFSTQPHPGSNNSQHRQQQQQSHSKHSKHNSKHGSKHNKQPQKDVDKQSDPALTGSTVWDGAVVLAQYLSSCNSPLHQHKAQRAAAAAASTTCISSRSDTNQQPSSCCGSQHQHDGQHQEQQQQEEEEEPPTTQQDQDLQCLQPQPDPAPPVHGFTCLELGAGTGAVSLCLLAAGVVDYAVVTDIPDMLPQLLSNVRHNSGVLDVSKALVLPLRWAEAADVAALQQLGQAALQQQQRPPHAVHIRQPFQEQQQQLLLQRPQQTQLQQPQLQPPFEVIVGSDLIYYSYTPSTPHSRLLLQALVQLSGPDTLIFLALSLHHNPEEVHAFLAWAEEDWGLGVQRVTEGIPAEYVVPDVLVAKLQLRDAEQAARAAAAAAAGTLRRKDEQP